MELENDEAIYISTAKDRWSKNWKHQKIKLSALYDRLSKTHRTHETHAEYMAMGKEKQANIKDIGGFVGGYLSGSRNPNNIKHRQLLTLDADHLNIEDNLWLDVELNLNCSVAMYSTHKHIATSPRLRLVIALSRPVNAEEYEAIARKVAERLGIDFFDDSTYQYNRLMYWPSTSKGGDFVFEYQDGPLLDANAVLAEYKNWQDVSQWPMSSRIDEVHKKLAKKQEDPLEKEGIVGAFCKSYTISEAIDEYLSDIYLITNEETRYTFANGSTSKGLIVYDDKFAYSHHSTDPCGGQLVNAFDLVRLHKFGELDKDLDKMNRGNRRPSFLAMVEFASKDSKVKKELLHEQVDGFDILEDENDDWLDALELEPKSGGFLATIENVAIILENDKNLKGEISYNELAGRPCTSANLPWPRNGADRWSDEDNAGLRGYLSKAPYKIRKCKEIIEDALIITSMQYKYHPVRDYLNSLEWDGEERLERLFIDYLGAEDSPYTQSVTRKSLVAAIARTYVPGTKFDHVITFQGPQGIGKSSIIKKLGKSKWFTDEVGDLEKDDTIKALQGFWIVELAELSALRKAEVEKVKHFITKAEDTFRWSYGRNHTTKPRGFVLFATTNNYSFLKDKTGNRRFWPIELKKEEIKKSIWDPNFDSFVVDQIWAEAKYYYELGEDLFLIGYTADEALKRQKMHEEDDPKIGMIIEFLEKPITEKWYNLTISERRDLIAFGSDESGIKRQKICAMEIWCECYGNRKETLNRFDTSEINTILDNLEEWERLKSDSRFGGEYGRQRGYKLKK